MSPRGMKIIGVICGIICVGTLSTLSLKAYLDASLSADTGYGGRQTETPVEIVEREPQKEGQTETVTGQEGDANRIRQQELVERSSLATMKSSVAGMAEILQMRRRETTVLGSPEKEQAQGSLDTEETITVSKNEESTAVTLITADTEEALLEDILSGRERYMEYLGELDLQVKKIYSDMENASIKEMQEAQDYAYRLWDDELNRIYPVLKRSLSEEDGEALKQAELQWIKDRDARAQRDSSGSTFESSRILAYTRSLTDTTRERTYLLVEWYFEANE